MGVSCIYKLVIADDEAMICSLIKRLIDWEPLQLECVGVASSGTDCLAMVEELRPDIVITDIRMPGLSGLELIERCLEKDSAVKFIIVSGYGQFDYAQKAIRYGVSDFLIKPIQREELNDALKRVVGVLSGTEMTDTERTVAPDMRHSLLLSLFLRDFSIRKHPDIAALNRAYGYRFGDGYFLPVAICIDAKEEALGHAQTVLSNMQSILCDELGRRCIDYSATAQDQMAYALFQFPEEAMDGLQVALQYAFDRMLIAIQPYDLYHVTMGRGCITGMEGLQDSFTKAVCAVEGRRHLGPDALYDGSTLELQLVDSSHISIKEPNHELTSALQTMDPQGFSAFFLQEYQRQMPDMKRFPYSLGAYSRAFFAAFGRDIRKTSGDMALSQDRETALLHRLSDCQSGDEINACLVDCAYALSAEMQSSRPDLKLIQQVKVYIDANYRHRITLEDAAREVFLSPGYLGILFKRETGENFTDYLAGVRLDKAKELLKDVRLNVGQVSDLVGYKDTHYFSKLFKRAVGITPAQYRKFLSIDQGEQ